MKEQTVVTEQKGSTQQEEVLGAPQIGGTQITATKEPLFALKMGKAAGAVTARVTRH